MGKSKPGKNKKGRPSGKNVQPNAEKEPPLAASADMEKIGRWAIVLVFFILVALMGMFKVYNLDLGIHLKTGEVIWKGDAKKPEYGSKYRIPRKNIYTYSRASNIITLRGDRDLEKIVRLRHKEKLNFGRVIKRGPGTVFRAFVFEEDPPGATPDKAKITLHIDTVIPSKRAQPPKGDFTLMCIPSKRTQPPKDDFTVMKFSPGEIASIERADWTDHEWLFQVVLYMVFWLLGANGLVLLRMAILIGMFYLLFKMAAHRSHYMVTIWVALVVIIASNLRFFMRPEIFSLFFTVYVFFCLDQFKYGSKKWVWSLPPLILVWTNMHGFFAVGLALVAFFLIGELAESVLEKYVPFMRVKDPAPLVKRDYFMLLGVLVAMFLVSFINPYGAEGALFPYKQLAVAEVFMQKISELKSPFSIQTHVIVKGLLFFKILLFAGIPILILGIRHVRLFWVAVFGIAAWQAAKSNRNIALFALGAFVPLCISLQALFEAVGQQYKKVKWGQVRIAAGAMFGVVFLYLFWSLVTSNFYVAERNTKRFGFGWSEFAYPEKAASWVKENNIPGIMFNNFDTGNYLIYRFFGWPKNAPKKVFIDGRTEVYGHHYYGDIYYNIMAPNPYIKDKGEYLNRYFDKLKIAFVLVKHSSNDIGNLPERLYPQFQRGMDPRTRQPIEIPARDSKWALVYLDETACVFVRRDPSICDYLTPQEQFRLRLLWQQNELSPSKLLARIQTEKFSDASEASKPFFHYNRGRFLKAIRQQELALMEFEAAVKARPDIEDFHNGYAAALYLVNHLQRAKIETRVRQLQNQAEKAGLGKYPNPKWDKHPQLKQQYNSLAAGFDKSFDPNAGVKFGEHETLKECFEHMELATDLNSGYFEAWKNKKIMYAQIRKFDEALKCHEMYEKVKKVPKDPKNRERQAWNREYKQLKIEVIKQYREIGYRPGEVKSLNINKMQGMLDVGGKRMRDIERPQGK
ncbi:MAG: hypothetical protein E3J72_09350 [Planctomycetota bacterium]|nr:MAG: hypothetical protein E3J72_09350 [Planctomycetota bacterium]